MVAIVATVWILAMHDHPWTYTQVNPFMPRKRLLGGFLSFFPHKSIWQPNEKYELSQVSSKSVKFEFVAFCWYIYVPTGINGLILTTQYFKALGRIGYKVKVVVKNILFIAKINLYIFLYQWWRNWVKLLKCINVFSQHNSHEESHDEINLEQWQLSTLI